MDEGRLDPLRAARLRLLQLAIVDRRVGLQHLDRALREQRMLRVEDGAQPLPVGALPRALHEQARLGKRPRLGVVGEQLPLVERFRRADDALLPERELRLGRVDQRHLPSLPPVHALGVGGLRCVPRAELLKRERVLGLVVHGAPVPHGKVGVAVAQKAVELRQGV
eukprot:1211877-Pleurochrysis_carterae.AAC.2